MGLRCADFTFNETHTLEKSKINFPLWIRIYWSFSHLDEQSKGEKTPSPGNEHCRQVYNEALCPHEETVCHVAGALLSFLL